MTFRYSNLRSKILSLKLVTSALQKMSLHLETMWQNPPQGAKTGIQKSLLFQADAIRGCWSICSLCAVTFAAFLYHFMKTVDKLPKLACSLAVKTFPGEVEGKKENCILCRHTVRIPSTKKHEHRLVFHPWTTAKLRCMTKAWSGSSLSRHFRT